MADTKNITKIGADVYVITGLLLLLLIASQNLTDTKTS